MLRDTPPAELLAGIRLVATGEALLAPSITEHLIECFIRRLAETVEAQSSTIDRERDVLALVAKGLSNAEIGSEL